MLFRPDICCSFRVFTNRETLSNFRVYGIWVQYKLYNDNTNCNFCFPGKDVVGLIKHGTLSPNSNLIFKAPRFSVDRFTRILVFNHESNVSL